jgi:hypothetical protein
MKLNIDKKETGGSLFGGGYKVMARLDATPEEIAAIQKRSLGGLELAKMPNSMGTRYAGTPLYLGEILGRDWECSCKTREDAEAAESLIIQACRDLKYKLEQEDTSGPRVIDL